MFGHVSFARVARLALLAVALPLGGCGASSLASQGPTLGVHDGYGLVPAPVRAELGREEILERSPLRDLGPDRKVVVVGASRELRIHRTDCPACRAAVR